MALFYRVVMFGKPQGPWRASRRQVRQDAIERGLGSYDEEGAFYVTVPGDIEWVHENELRKRA